MSASSGAGPERVAIILHSGSYDRVAYSISMATVALAMGCEVQMLLTFDALWRFRKGHLQDIGGETAPLLREKVERGMANGGMQPLAQVVAGAKTLGLKIYACPNAMAQLNISRDELAEEIDGVKGLAAFMGFAIGAASTWYV